MKESHLRSLIKAASWRMLGTCGTMIIAFFLTHKISISFYIGLFEFVSKIGLFYLHERAWNAIPFGIHNLQATELTNKILNSMNEEHA